MTEQLWSDERIREVVRLHSVYRALGMCCLTAAAAEIELTRMRDDLQARIDELEAELRAVLDVAIARGEQLDYSDDDYRARLKQLGGTIENEVGDD